MRSLTILVDMDDTIENLCKAWVKELNKRHGTKVKPSDIHEWDMSKSFPGLPMKEIYAPLHSESFWDTVKPIPGAPEALERLCLDGHRVIIVTASHPDTVPMKLNKVLFKYFPYLGYRDVIIASQKDVVIGDVRIDDNPENLTLARDKSLRILFTQPHNKSFNATYHGIVRADNWVEILGMINGHVNLLNRICEQ